MYCICFFFSFAIMLQKSLTYMLLLMILSQFLVKINSQETTSFRPKQRCYHTASFINKKLYISGGQSFNGSIDIVGADFFYLDFSLRFNNTQELLWYNLSNNSSIPSHTSSATSVKGGANNDTLFVYGGFSPNQTDLVYRFNSQSYLWDIPIITSNNNNIVIKKRDMMGVINI